MKNSQEIILQNRLIAFFTDAKVGESEDEREVLINVATSHMKTVTVWTESLKYHCSFDWIIPACEKANKLQREYITKGIKANNVLQYRFTFDIKSTHKRLVNFIEWHNKHKSPNNGTN